VSNGVYCSTGAPGVARSCGDALPQFRMHQSGGPANDRFAASCCTVVHNPGIGLEMTRALVCCTEIQNGWLTSVSGVPASSPEFQRPDRRCFGVAGAGDAEIGIEARSPGCCTELQYWFWRVGLGLSGSPGLPAGVANPGRSARYRPAIPSLWGVADAGDGEIGFAAGECP
jgi:hypothetical protein